MVPGSYFYGAEKRLEQRMLLGSVFDRFFDVIGEPEGGKNYVFA